MNKQPEPRRTKWLAIRVSKTEYKHIEKLSLKAIAFSLSDCGRRVLPQEPTHVKRSNQSLDDFLADMLLRRR